MNTKRVFQAAIGLAVVLPAAVSALNFWFLDNDPLSRHFTEEDWKISNEVFEHAVEHNADGVASEWHNPDSGASGTVKPLRSYEGERGERCRTMLTEDHANRLSNRYTFDWCKGADGVWRMPAQEVERGKPPAGR